MLIECYAAFSAGYEGGQAQYVRVPFANSNCLPVPPYLKASESLQALKVE